MSGTRVWMQQTLVDIAPDAKARKYREDLTAKARQRIGEFLFPKISTIVGGRPRLVDQPPLLFHISEKGYEQRVHEALEDYRQSLQASVRVLFDRYRLADVAIKVVGIGSVGTRCFVGLFFSTENHPLLLQFKEARTSVLAPYAGKSRFDNQGERVVVGQRLMQSSSDIFLGWLRSRRGVDYFARQLRDMKFSVPLDDITPLQLKRYAELCGWTLARAHAKSGDAATISGYLGKTDVFDQAIGLVHINHVTV